jgi:Ceramidase
MLLCLHPDNFFMALTKRSLQFILITITVLASIAVFFSPVIEQDLAYHQFADRRTLFAIPNFWNVISNGAFLWVGAIGLYRLYKNRLNIVYEIRHGYFIFFIAVAFIAFGSAYYHWQPNNLTLVWDRLPMTFTFMSLMAFVVAENLSVKWGRNSLFPVLFIGFISVCYWYWGELHSAGDLRLYALVQFLPMVLLLVLLMFGQSAFQNKAGYWWLFAAYALAKVAEHFDAAIFNYTSGMLAGHVLKHLFAAAGLYVLVMFFEKRIPKNILNTH